MHSNLSELIAELFDFTLENPKIEQLEILRGQIGIGKEDFLQLETLIKEVDIIAEEGYNSTKNSVLVFEKMLNKRYFSVWEVRTVKKKRKINRLFFVTMYARPK